MSKTCYIRMNKEQPDYIDGRYMKLSFFDAVLGVSDNPMLVFSNDLTDRMAKDDLSLYEFEYVGDKAEEIFNEILYNQIDDADIDFIFSLFHGVEQ